MGGSSGIWLFPLFNKAPPRRRHSVRLAMEAAPFDSNGTEEQVKLLSLLQLRLNLCGITAPLKSVLFKCRLRGTLVNEKVQKGLVQCI